MSSETDNNQDNDYKKIFSITLKSLFGVGAIVTLLISALTDNGFFSLIAGLCVVGFAAVIVIDNLLDRWENR